MVSQISVFLVVLLLSGLKYHATTPTDSPGDEDNTCV